MTAFSAYGALLNPRAGSEKKVDVGTLSEAVRKHLLADPGIAGHIRARSWKAAAAPARRFSNQMPSRWNRERSADVQFALKPYWMDDLSPASPTTARRIPTTRTCRSSSTARAG